MDKKKIKEILKIIWQDASKWGKTFGESPAIEQWLDTKVEEICKLADTK